MPQLKIEDCVSYEVNGVLHLTEYLIRFQLVRPRKISEYVEFVLDGRSDVDELFPEAPNREAVLYNVNAVKKNLENIFFRIKKSWFARTYNIQSAGDFLKFSVDHTSHPTYIFTNGQRFISLVIRNERFEIVQQSMRLSMPEQEVHELIDPDLAKSFSSYSAAETAIRKYLSELQFVSVLIGDGSHQETMLLQAAGTAHSVETYLVWVRGECYRLQVNRHLDAYTLVNSFRPNGFRIESCGTCKHFRMSGMSGGMSNGSAGYCTKRLVSAGKPEHAFRADEPSPLTIVSVWDRCCDFFLGEPEAQSSADRAISRE